MPIRKGKKIIKKGKYELDITCTLYTISVNCNVFDVCN